MKKQILTIISLLLIFSAVPAYAVTPTPTDKTTHSPTIKPGVSEKLNNQINELKEKIASRVSELNLVEKRGMIGVVTEVSGNKITLTDVAGKTRLVDVDEITKFSSAANKSFGLSDITKGTRLSILGLYNKQSKRILARFINTTTDPNFLSGSISELDTKNFFITITTLEQKQIKIDVQTSTKLLTANKDGDLTKYGFSKMEIGDRIVVIGYPDKKDTKVIVSDRVIIFSTLPQNPKIKVNKPEPTETQAPSPTPKKSKATATP
ncbi:hypothetical protein HZA75_05980 [Candidatus Roizmanbacteria bacterium]|nr:hypothetical protein [Candidatus Roizmanbacteria bacterium]